MCTLPVHHASCLNLIAIWLKEAPMWVFEAVGNATGRQRKEALLTEQAATAKKKKEEHEVCSLILLDHSVHLDYALCVSCLSVVSCKSCDLFVHGL